MFLFGLGKLIYTTYRLISLAWDSTQQYIFLLKEGNNGLTQDSCFAVIVLIINAIAILSEDRFLARIGWGRTQYDPGFGAAVPDNTSIKAKSVNLIASVRTVMRISTLAISANFTYIPSFITPAAERIQNKYFNISIPCTYTDLRTPVGSISTMKSCLRGMRLASGKSHPSLIGHWKDTCEEGQSGY
ncbi:conserved hypothetical protein [Histoplasma capsulatum H143]|uniref:Uncharacterized protein n=1 Tax=Ajellomyces capsulatus (strain H143) TaxID=544712 RepID=C6H2R9_AJECH|nr:conserved hypothetical protein [Histoplasma capsulatum H143]